MTTRSMRSPGWDSLLISARGLTAVLSAAVVSGAIMAATARPTTSSPVPQSRHTAPPKMFKDARQSLAIARAGGRAHITLLVAAKNGRAAALAAHAAQVGGDVRYRDDQVDYLRVRLPINQAHAFSEHDDVESVTTDMTDEDPFRVMSQRSALSIDAASTTREPEIPRATSPRRNLTPTTNDDDDNWPPRGWGEYPLTNPYIPLKDIDGVDMRRENPTFDGRGVTIAVLDGNFDFLLPVFQTAYDLDGSTIGKVADFVNISDPRDDAKWVPQWVNMQAQVEARSGSVTHKGKTFTTPRDGAFRIGLFNERRFNVPANAAYIDQDVDRNGNPRGDDGLFGVLWDESTNDVWVDTNRDLSFADETALTDFIDRPVFGVFGEDDPETDIRESIGFAVQTDADNKFVALNLGIYQHATTIMGSVVGNKHPNGRVEGVAPGARMASFYYSGGGEHGLIEGLIAAFSHPLVDLIVLEQSVAYASMSYALADGHHPISVIAQRLIDHYQKLVFVPGGNSPGFGIVAEDGLAPGAMSIGGYQSSDSYRANLGFVPEGYDHWHWGGRSHGPAGNGALKPDILAPSGQIGTEVGYLWRPAIQEKPGLYTLPPGYGMDGGTSTATPMASGAAALVVSAAKQSGVPHDAVRLKHALMSGARHLPNLPQSGQGAGLIQSGASFEILKQLAGAPPITIVSRGPVRNKLSGLMATPHEGPGLYERGGWAVGDRDTRIMRFTRTSGPGGSMTFAVRWSGNDGTFTSAASIDLPLNQQVEFPIDINISSAGAHSAAIQLTHESVPGIAHQTLATVVVPLEFTAESDYTITTELSVPRPDDQSVFVVVPPGTAALTVSMRSPDGQVGFAATSPSREQMYPCGFGVQSAKPCVIEYPEPGVWELNASMDGELRQYQPRRDEPLMPGTVTITASIIDIDITTDASVAVEPDGSADIDLHCTNRLAPVKARVVSTELGSARRASRAIKRGEQHLYELIVPEGATSISAQVSGVSGSGSDLDIYLIDCTALGTPQPQAPPEKDTGNKMPSRVPDGCVPKAKASTIASGGRVEFANPTPGRWLVVVDAFQTSGESTRYQYQDVITVGQFGGVLAADTAARRKRGDAWDARAHAWIANADALGDGRSPVARVIIGTDDFYQTEGAMTIIAVRDIDLTRD